ncbi:MAG: hypothetical protein ACAI38_06200 [Myxococcota bacterium]|nr:hypothetical protein [Myxococcota bacterium]
MKTTEYANLAATQKAQAFDALMGKTGEYIARFGQKPLVVSLDKEDLQIADLYVRACMAKREQAVVIGSIGVPVDPTQFSTSMAALGAYMATNGIEQITISDPEQTLRGGFPPGSIIGAALEALLNSNRR